MKFKYILNFIQVYFSFYSIFGLQLSANTNSSCKSCFVTTEAVRMKPCKRGKYGGKPALVAAVILSTTTLLNFTAVRAATDQQFLYVEVSDVTRPPIGWIEFWATHLSACGTTPPTPPAIGRTRKGFKYL